MGIVDPKKRMPKEKNPFLKPEVKLISDELRDAGTQNMREAIDKKYPAKPTRRRPGGGAPYPIGASRG